MDLWTLSDLCTPWCVHVVATLRVADHILAGKSAIDELAPACGCDRDSLDRVMRHLVGKGLFEEPSPGRFALNEASRGLLGDGRIGLGLDGIGGRMAHAWNTLLSAVRTGRCAYSEAFGVGFWEDLQAHSEIAADFDALMGLAGHGVPDWRVLVNAEDWDSVRSVVDVGGGTGALLAEILKARPYVRGTLVDLPSTVARSGAVFRDAGVADRVTIVGQSFFDPLPGGADVYVLKSVLADWPDAEAAAILRRCSQAAGDAGRVVVFTGAGPGEAASPELLMMVLVGGKARSLDELNGLAAKAGLAFSAVGRQASGRVVVEYRALAGLKSRAADSLHYRPKM